MKKLILAIAIGLVSIASFSQTATNADGTLALRGNVSIFSTYSAFTFKDGVFKKQISDKVAEDVRSANRALAMQLFTNAAFGIVNRDDKAYENVMKLLEENKSEDYIDGIAVQAKGQGADCIFLVDNTMLTKDNFVQYFYSCRFISVVNNSGYHFSLKSNPIEMGNTEKERKELALLTKNFINFLQQHILDVYPEQYGIAAAKGKKLHLVAYQTNGAIQYDDKFHVFKYSQEPLNYFGNAVNVPVLDKLGEASLVGLENGYLAVKTKKSITPSNDIFLFRNQAEPKLTAGAMPFTFFELPVDITTYEGFIKNRVNNALYDAITRHPGATLIEQELLPELKSERELQKTEDFLDGYTVKKVAAIGAQAMFHIENFQIKGSQVSFLLNMVSVAENRIVRSVPVTTSIDNIEDEMYRQICERVAFPCQVTVLDKKVIEVLSGWSIPKGGGFVVEVNKQITNPVNGEVSYTVVPICKCRVSRYMANKNIAMVTEILNKKELKSLQAHSKNGTLTIKMDGSAIPLNESEQSAIDKIVDKKAQKEKQKEKTGGFFKELLQITL